MTRHFLDIGEIESAVLRGILDRAKSVKAARSHLPHGAQDPDPLLSGFALGMVFSKPSTRTRLSFDIAIRQAGGHAISLENSQMGRGETPGDTARVLARMVDVVAARLGDHSDLLAMASANEIPVINALTDRSHPCQLMADVLTMETHLGDLSGRRVAWLGDGNNVATSLIEASDAFGFEVSLACPDGYRPDAAVLEWASARGHSIDVLKDPRQAARGADVVMTDTWVSMGDPDTSERHEALADYQVNADVMAAARPGALFMHCLPAHRGEEVTDAVMDGAQSVVWETAENRLHVQKAILAWVLGRI